MIRLNAIIGNISINYGSKGLNASGIGLNTSTVNGFSGMVHVLNLRRNGIVVKSYLSLEFVSFNRLIQH
jgi:hypothetical protein